MLHQLQFKTTAKKSLCWPQWPRPGIFDISTLN